MASVADDVDALLAMINEAAGRLRAKEPEHELLEFMRRFDDDAVYAKFVERFRSKKFRDSNESDTTRTAWMYVQYFRELRAALGELPVTGTGAPITPVYMENYDDMPPY